VGPPLIQPGDVVGDFEVVREVGRGAMGVVYEARQRSLPRRVALKTLLPNGDRSWMRRFRTETSAAARLSHPGIAPVFAVGRHGRTPWYAMEYVDGRAVSSLLRRDGAMEARRAAAIVRDAALALDHAHAQGVVHRDVKPGNLILRKDGRVVLTDFGLAKRMADGDASVTAPGGFVGSPNYLSPEQARGGEVTPATDVYGLGVTLYRMTTNRPPFRSEDTATLLRSIAESEPPPLRSVRPDLPRDLETIVATCMEKEPARRYPSARAVADDLDRFLHDEPLARRARGPIRSARGFVARHRGAVLAASVALGIAAILLARGRGADATAGARNGRKSR
jgi:serine/threonine protein kinase